MKIVACQVTAYDRRLAHPVTTHAGTFVKRTGSLVRLQSETGETGVGDAAWWPGFGSSTEVFATGAARIEALVGTDIADVAQLAALLPTFGLPPEWAYAYELACLDLLGQRDGVSIARLLCDAPQAQVHVHALVSDAVAAQDAARRGARSIKFKVGARLLEEDVLRVGAVRAAIGGQVGLRLDANGAWSPQVALKFMHLLAAFSPEWLEQPVPADDVAGLESLRAARIMPIAADEAAGDATRLQQILATSAADIVILKPMAMGGLLSCQSWQRRAAEHGVRSIVTHALESGVGRLGALHLAAALPDGQTIAGLGGALDGDVVAPALQRDFICDVPQAPGLGAVGTANWPAWRHKVAS